MHVVADQLVYVGLGANLGDPAAQIQAALAHLNAHPAVTVLQVAALYKSAPVGPVQDQPWFFNTVAKLDTTLTPTALLALCQQVEHQLGRRRQIDQGPRTIDLDILLYGDECVYEPPELVIPHPALTQRAFVLLPLLEMIPRIKHPVTGQPLHEIAKALPPQPIEKLTRLIE